MESVISCTKIKEWQGKPIYAIGLSDGRGGESFSNIPTGTNVSDLSIEESNYGLKIKLKKPEGGGFGGGRQRSGNESFSLSYAKDYAVAVIGTGKDFKSDDILALADKFYNWLEAKKK